MLSRRDFLKVMGISVLAGAVPAALNDQISISSTLSQPIRFSPVRGRLIHGIHSENIPPLFANTIVSILGEAGDDYLTEHGRIDRTIIQPILEMSDAGLAPSVGEFAEVIAPVAAIRRWAVLTAPAATFVGHGGVLMVADAISLSETDRWLLMIGADGEPLGWTPARQWRSATFETMTELFNHLRIDTHRRMMTAYRDDKPLLEAPVALSPHLESGEYPMAKVSCSQQDAASLSPLEGMPYWFALGRHKLSGAYFHNSFGYMFESELPGAEIQVAPFVGRWLYQHVGQFVTARIV
jgi:hypothetical protein